jgi:transcriptional regulator with XRE-family HTH domain
MAPKRETAKEIWGKELSHAMEAAGVTGRQLAKELSVEPSTVSHWINGKRTPHIEDVRRTEKILGTNGYLERNQKWVSRESSPEWFEWRGVEEDATELLNYENFTVPGLLQTPRHAQAILDSEDQVTQRLERQQVFDKGSPPAFEALLDESVLYRKVGNAEIMAEQLNHLLSIAERDDISIRIVPLSADIKRFTYSFLLATVGSGKQVGYAESVLKGRIVERPEDVAELRRSWVRLSSVALSKQDSIDLIQKTLKERWSPA